MILFGTSGILHSRRGFKRALAQIKEGLGARALLRALVDRKVSGIIIRESPALEQDAIMLWREYKKMFNREKRQ